MLRLRSALALVPGLACLGSSLPAFADEPAAAAAPAPTESAATEKGKPRNVAAVDGQVGGQAAIGTSGASASGTADAAVAPPPGEMEETWMPWNTGGEEADMGFAFFGHLGLGSRLNDGPAGDPDAPNGLRIGITGIFRPIRYFGFGIGYEHADLERTRNNSVDGAVFEDS